MSLNRVAENHCSGWSPPIWCCNQKRERRRERNLEAGEVVMTEATCGCGRMCFTFFTTGLLINVETWRSLVLEETTWDERVTVQQQPLTSDVCCSDKSGWDSQGGAATCLRLVQLLVEERQHEGPSCWFLQQNVHLFCPACKRLWFVKPIQVLNIRWGKNELKLASVRVTITF